MQAIRVRTPGDPGVLQLEEIPDPRPGAGEALVRLEAIGVNFLEVYQRKGWYTMPLPFTPGTEGAGTVVALGEGVTVVRVGDRVASVSFRGSYAELAVASADRLVLLPEELGTREAAAMMLQGMTAHYLATSTHPVGPRDWCLIHAAAGGVGLFLCQIAKRRRAQVIGTTSTPAKAAVAREAGADNVILYTKQDFVAEVRRLTDGKGVSVVYDSVGKATFEGSLDCLASRGMLVLFGQSSGPVSAFDPQILNQKGSLFLTRPSLPHYVTTRHELMARASDVFGWARDGTLRVRIGAELPLARASEAHRALEGRGTTGKLLLIPRAEV
jgi:NADPH2:quinone reductase